MRTAYFLQGEIYEISSAAVTAAQGPKVVRCFSGGLLKFIPLVEIVYGRGANPNTVNDKKLFWGDSFFLYLFGYPA